MSHDPYPEQHRMFKSEFPSSHILKVKETGKINLEYILFNSI